MAQPIWNTTAGSIGSFPSLISAGYQFSASYVYPATSITYAIISGTLPVGLSLNSSGYMSGIPAIVSSDTLYTFVIRVTDNLGELRDRTFSMSISGSITPSFTTPAGSILSAYDSAWIELPITYDNPISTNEVSIRIIQGNLPPGLEINREGLIRGYPEPPVLNINLSLVNTSSTVISSNVITCLSTTGFRIGRPILFSGTVFGGVTAGQTYYIDTIIDESTFTITTSIGGPQFLLTDSVGFMTITLPGVTIGQPTIKTYSFTLKLESLLGSDIESYTISITNQNTPLSSGGPGFPENSRIPTIYNTRPGTYNIESSLDYRYYILPPDSGGHTYDPNQLAYIGRIESDNIFSFKILGHDFDNNALVYSFADLPLGLVGNTTTGWISGNPQISQDNISEFSFKAAVWKAANPNITSPYINFSFRITNDLVGDITWITPSDLGQMFNGTVSDINIFATSDVELNYRLVGGALPPNLTLLTNGELTGKVAYQPTNVFMQLNDTADFTFTIQAFSPLFPAVQSNKTFTLSILQEYTQPTDTLYIKCTPSMADREVLRSLLEDDNLIPPEVLYRPQDVNFGKASNVIYEHAYGIHASSINDYIASVTKNHYWRNITLGEIKTAIARNDAGDIIYEVVYSSVIDNLINPDGISIPEEIIWPRYIDLNQGPWYTSVTNIYTSYVSSGTGVDYYTSLSPGYTNVLYPNSLVNMRARVGQELGQEYNFRLLPKWMTSQQENGSTLGFTPAWVICYTKPGFSATIKNNIETNWKDFLGDTITLNEINFRIDRFTVDKSMTYDYENSLNPPAWTTLPSATPTPDPQNSRDFYALFPRKNILPD